jgi:hypothetical protein
MRASILQSHGRDAPELAPPRPNRAGAQHAMRGGSMRTQMTAVAAFVLVATMHNPAQAQRQNTRITGTRNPAVPGQACQGGSEGARAAAANRAAHVDTAAYDVVLDIPNLCVDRINLRVKNLSAHVALDAQVANLVQLTAGADVAIGTVDLRIVGVKAQALLLVDLDNVTYIADQALSFIDQNPDVLKGVLQSVDQTVNTVGGLANTALQPGGVVSQTVGVVGNTVNNLVAPNGVLSQVVNTAGMTVQRTLMTTGEIVERTLGVGGQVVASKAVGRLTDMQTVKETAGAGGAVVRQVRDATGALLEYTLNNGAISNVRVLQAASGGR